MPQLPDFLKRLFIHRSLIMTMAVQELRSRYSGTLAGSLWSLANPLITILVYWFVFSVGLKVSPIGDVPFILFFAVGLIPWTTLSETLTLNSGVVIGNTHLIKKMVFPSEILPIVNLVASLIVHLVMLALVLVIFVVYGYGFSFYNLQFIYYLAALFVLCVGLGWFFAAVNVFHRDIGQMLGLVLNVWFWLTPIVYGAEMLPEKYRFFLKLNPMFYVVEGYRNSFIYHVPFWEAHRVGLYFWCVSLIVLFVGGFVFKRLKHEFAEVL